MEAGTLKVGKLKLDPGGLSSVDGGEYGGKMTMPPEDGFPLVVGGWGWSWSGGVWAAAVEKTGMQAARRMVRNMVIRI